MNESILGGGGLARRFPGHKPKKGPVLAHQKGEVPRHLVPGGLALSLDLDGIYTTLVATRHYKIIYKTIIKTIEKEWSDHRP